MPGCYIVPRSLILINCVKDDPAKDFRPADFDYKKELIGFCEVRKTLTSNKSVVEKVYSPISKHPEITN